MLRTPSYITNRNGTYYFQCAVPKHVKSDKKLIRRSLRTSCRSLALAKARKWWTELSENNYQQGKKQPTAVELAQWDAGSQRINEELALGKRVYERLEDHEAKTQYHNGESDPLAVDDFMESLTSTEYAALRLYNSHINSIEVDDTSTPQAPRTVSEKGNGLESKIILDVMDDNHKAQMLKIRGLEHTGVPLSDLLDRYIKSKARKSKKSVMDKGLYDTETEIQRLIMFVGNVANDELTKSLLEERYINRRQFLPNMVHRNPLYKVGMEMKTDRLTGKQALDRNGKPLEKPVYKPINEIITLVSNNVDAKFNVPRTINNEFGNIATFCRSMEESGYIEKGLGDYLTKNKLEDEEDTTVISFTDGDLKLMFANETYEKGLLFDSPHRHWLPLISLYHGNRIGEVAMLYVDDLIQIDVNTGGQSEAVWAFVIQRNLDRQQGRKNKQSARIVPIHQALIDLGLIEYRQQLIDSGEKQLFPHEKPTGGHNWGNNTSGWFNNSHDGNTGHGVGYAQWCGVDKHVVIDGVEKKKVFHSLRKNWSTQAKRLGLDRDIRRELTGHGEGMKLDVHAKDYEGNYEVWQHKEQLNKVNFNIDLTKIKKWS